MHEGSLFKKINTRRLSFPFTHKKMLVDVAVQATRIVLIAFIFFGTIGNILSLLIFTRRTLLRSSCTLYLIADSINNILVIYTSLLTRLLATGYNDNISLISDSLCKLRAYLSITLLALSPYFFTLACFDRYCSSSRSATRRSCSNKKVAKRLIIAAIILAFVLYVHLPIFYALNASGTSCSAQSSAYNIFYKIFYLIIYCILPPSCMGSLCILTLKNVREQAQRIQPGFGTGNESLRRMDRQMVIMLFSQVLTQLLCVLPHAIISLLALCINTTTTIYVFFNDIFILPLYVSYTTSFYVFTLSSRIYRQELMKIFGFGKLRQGESDITMATIATNPTTRREGKTTTTNLQKR